ncbi:MAG: ribonuclease protein component [Bacteroidota bacterium]|jgi:ribonuclease P protein component
MIKKRFKLPRGSKLKSRKKIGKLFESGKSKVVYPLKAIWQEGEKTQIAVSVPKRNFKKAIERNLLKRRIREVWRQNPDLPEGIEVIFIFIGNKEADFNELNSSMLSLIKRISTSKAEKHEK